MKFKDFLSERVGKHVVLAFGRFNPPTIGHGKLVNKVQDIAKTLGGTAHVVLSHSQDSKKNPLTPQQKLKHAKRAFPEVNISVSDASAPHFLSQASKIYKQGATHFHMVGGADRVEEFTRLLNKYNGVKGPHGQFKFKSIKVHSAGERDPDADGIEGMSASKMRELASKGNFKEFRKGVPSKLTDNYAKELYNDVRKGMNIKEDINLDFEDLIIEGVHDKGIFKAVFLFGGPGSGKDYVLSRTLEGNGLTEINSDKAFEYLMDKNRLDKNTMPDSEKERRNAVRSRAKNTTELKQQLALMGRNGLIINGTGDDPEKIARIKSKLEDLGYETSGIMVNTADEVSKQRNIERGRRGGRTVPEDIRKEKWDSVQAARPEFSKMFGDKYAEFDNSEDLKKAPKEIVDKKEEEILKLFKNFRNFINTPPKNQTAKEWISSELDKKDTQEIDTSREVTPHPDSSAADEAKKMGLQYYGFGRYGTKGRVTHRSIHDKLVQTKRINEDLRQWFDPKHPDGGWKRINSKGEVIGDCAREPGEPKPKCMSNQKRNELSKKERASAVRAKRKHDSDPERKGAPINVSNFGKGKLSESVTFSVTADTPEELNQMFSQMFDKTVQTKQENYAFSSKNAENMLLLGTKKIVTEINDKSVTFSNEDVDNILKINDNNYIVDKNNRPRVFVVRALAAKEAHIKKGEVVKTQKGYLVKLKENENDSIFKKSVNTDYGSSNTGSKTNFLTEESRPKKITISQIYNRKKTETHKESIDKGIEPGVSMSGSGESVSRDTGEKHKKNGKSSQVVEDENLGEMAGANMNTRDVHVHLKKHGWQLTRTGGGHDVYVHDRADHHIAVPRHKQLKAPLVVGILKSSKKLREMTGDETTASIGDQKEDELKKKGVLLATFKKRNYV
jgi:predicted RNA binding protein YcfA (HicA-like mRNA interferase family)